MGLTSCLEGLQDLYALSFYDKKERDETAKALSRVGVVASPLIHEDRRLYCLMGELKCIAFLSNVSNVPQEFLPIGYSSPQGPRDISWIAPVDHCSKCGQLLMLASP